MLGVGIRSNPARISAPTKTAIVVTVSTAAAVPVVLQCTGETEQYNPFSSGKEIDGNGNRVFLFLLKYTTIMSVPM